MDLGAKIDWLSVFPGEAEVQIEREKEGGRERASERARERETARERERQREREREREPAADLPQAHELMCINPEVKSPTHKP